jgi:hypothetical protein
LFEVAETFKAKDGKLMDESRVITVLFKYKMQFLYVHRVLPVERLRFLDGSLLLKENSLLSNHPENFTKNFNLVSKSAVLSCGAKFMEQNITTYIGHN